MSGRKKEPMKFSQFDEEPILLRIFGVKGKGRAADIGARGRQGSNLAWAVDRGWECQLIDKQTDQLDKDFGRDKNVTVVRRAITPANVNEVLWTNLDLLSIDIDGPDADVWEAIETRPLVVVIEAMPENREKIMRISKERGYVLEAETGPNLIYT